MAVLDLAGGSRRKKSTPKRRPAPLYWRNGRLVVGHRPTQVLVYKPKRKFGYKPTKRRSRRMFNPKYRHMPY